MSKLHQCPNCKEETKMRHLHDAAHGLQGTHIDGSERFECSSCNTTLTRHAAESIGLKYVIDVDA